MMYTTTGGRDVGVRSTAGRIAAGASTSANVSPPPTARVAPFASSGTSGASEAAAALCGLAEDAPLSGSMASADQQARSRPLKKSTLWLNRWRQMNSDDNDKENRPPSNVSQPTHSSPGRVPEPQPYTPRQPLSRSRKSERQPLGTMTNIDRDTSAKKSSATIPSRGDSYATRLPAVSFAPSVISPTEASPLSPKRRQTRSRSTNATFEPATGDIRWNGKLEEATALCTSSTAEENSCALDISLTSRRKCRMQLRNQQDEKSDTATIAEGEEFADHLEPATKEEEDVKEHHTVTERAAMKKARQLLDESSLGYVEAQTGESEEDSDEYLCDEDNGDDEYKDNEYDQYESSRTRKRRSLRSPVPAPSGHSSASGSLEAHGKRRARRVGVDREDIVRLINNEETVEDFIARTGFSLAYVKKLQRRVLRSSPALQPRPWHEHSICGRTLHVLYGLDEVPMFIGKELCSILGVCDTALTYWKRKANAEEVETYQDFRLMDQCREIFQGRATYTLFPAKSLLKMMREMEESKQKTFETPEFEKLLRKVTLYAEDKVQPFSASRFCPQLTNGIVK